MSERNLKKMEKLLFESFKQVFINNEESTLTGPKHNFFRKRSVKDGSVCRLMHPPTRDNFSPYK